MNRRIVGALYKKEITDILRDKKTILMMIVIPLILYPLIFMGSMYFATSMAQASTTKSYRIGFDQVEQETELKSFILSEAEKKEYQFIYSVPGGLESETDMIQLEREEEGETFSSYEEALQKGYLNAYLTMDNTEGEISYVIVYLASETDSQTAASMLEEMLEAYNVELSRRQIEASGLDPDSVLHPINYHYSDQSTNEETMGSLLGMILPFMLIVSILMGALYPAIDTTAGEKERGTLETLLTLPVHNLEMIMSKFLATSTVAVAAAFLNMISMGFMAAYMYETLQSMQETELEFNALSYLPAIGIMVLCVIVFAMFASAVCLCVCIFAKSFKEAQNYTTPILLVFMFGGMAGMIPMIELTPVTSLIPVVNIVLLISNLFQFKFDMASISAVLVSNIAYSLLAVILMTKFFDSEAILFGDGAGSFRLMERRSNMKKKQIPGIGDLVLLFSILILIILFVGSLAMVKYGIWGLVLEEVLILGITLFYAWYIKVDIPTLFHLKMPKIRDLFSGFLLWAGCYILMMLLGSALSLVFKESAESVNDTFSVLLEGVPVWLVVFALAILPPIAEEMAFRGILFGTLEKKYKVFHAILATGIFFGLYHMNLVKFFVVGILGCVLAYAVFKTKSIMVSIWMHFLNNLTAVILMLGQDDLRKWLPFLFEENLNVGTVIMLLVAGVLLFAAGLLLMRACFKKEKTL